MLAAVSNNNVECRTFSSARLDILRAHGGSWSKSVRDDLAFEVAAKLRDVFVLAIQYGSAASRKRFDQFVLSARNLRNRAEEF